MIKFWCSTNEYKVKGVSVEHISLTNGCLVYKHYTKILSAEHHISGACLLMLPASSLCGSLFLRDKS